MNHTETWGTAKRHKAFTLLTLLVAGVAVLSVFRATAASAQASSSLIPLSAASPELSSIQTYAGAAGVSLSAIRPSPSTTVVLLMDTETPASSDSVKTGLLALYGSLQGRPLRLAILHQGSLETVGPFSSRAGLQRALDKLDKIVPPDP